MKKGILMLFLLLPALACAICTESPPEGNWLINKSIECNDTEIVLTGNLTVNSTLTFRNTTLQMNASSNGQFRITVQNNSAFYILNDSVIGSNTSSKYIFLALEGSHIEILDSTITDAGYANSQGQFGLEIYSDNNIIRNSDFIENYMGLTLIGANDNNVSDNLIMKSGSVGLQILNDCAENRILSNQIINNTLGFGIGVDMEYNASDNYLAHNIIQHNTEGMELLFQSNDNHFVNDSFSYNRDLNAYVFQSDNTFFLNCRFVNDTGVYVYNRVNLAVVQSNNTIFNSSRILSYLTGTSYLIDVEDSPYTYFFDTVFYSSIRDAWFSNSFVYMINGSFPEPFDIWWGDTTARWFKQEYLAIQVNYTNSSPSDANISISNSYDHTADFTGQTNPDGAVSNILLTDFVARLHQSQSPPNNGINYTYFTPYSITASDGDYANYSSVDINVAGFIQLTLVDIADPVIDLLSPLDLLTDLTDITFQYSVSDVSDISNCSLYINSAYINTTYSPVIGTNTFSQTLGLGEYTWRIHCIDAYNNSAWSTTGYFNITDQDSSLSIWDDSSSATYPLSQVGFFADYSNLSDGSPINDTIGQCLISFDDMNDSMIYNDASMLYAFNRSFAAEGTYDYRIDCNSTSFFPRSSSGSVTVNKKPVDEGAGSRGGSSPIIMKGGGSDSTTGEYFDLSDATAKQGDFFRINFEGMTYHLSLLKTDGMSAFFVLDEDRFGMEEGEERLYDLDKDGEDDILIELVDIIGDEVLIRVTPAEKKMQDDLRTPEQPAKTPDKEEKVIDSIVEVPLPGPLPDNNPTLAVIGIVVILVLAFSVGYYLLFVKRIMD